MKIQQNNKKKQYIVASTLIATLLILFIGVSGYLFASGKDLLGWTPFPKQQQSSTGNNPASKEQIKNGEAIKTEAIKNSGTSGSDQPSTPQPQSDGRRLIELDITSITKVDSSLIKISTLISFLDQSGSCVLTINDSSSNTVYTSTVGVQAMSNSSTCRGFNVPIANLLPGKYKFNLAYTSIDNKNYGSAVKSYDLQ